MIEKEPQLEAMAAHFARERNTQRISCVNRFLSEHVPEEKLRHFLEANITDVLRKKTETYPHILGHEVNLLQHYVSELLEDVLEDTLEEASFIRHVGDTTYDDTSVMTGSVGVDHDTLWNRYWDGDTSILLGDHVGMLRTYALMYKFIDSPFGPLQKLLKEKIRVDVQSTLEHLQADIAEYDRIISGDTDEVEPRLDEDTPLTNKIKDLILSTGEQKKQVDALIEEGVDPRIARARIYADFERLPIEQTKEDLASFRKSREETQSLLNEVAAEFETLQTELDTIVSELLNTAELDHILQIHRFTTS